MKQTPVENFVIFMLLPMLFVQTSWVAEKKLPYKFIFTGNSGHELAQHQGTHIFLHENAPKPEEVRLWFHLGASLATYAYAKTGSGVEKLSRVDTNRIVYFAESLEKPVNEAFTPGRNGQCRKGSY